MTNNEQDQAEKQVDHSNKIEILKEEISSVEKELRDLKTKFYIYLAPMIFFMQEGIRRQNSFTKEELALIVLFEVIIGLVIVAINFPKDVPDSENNLKNSVYEYYQKKLRGYLKEYDLRRELFSLMQFICILLYLYLSVKFAFPGEELLTYYNLSVSYAFLTLLIIISVVVFKGKLIKVNSYTEIDYSESIGLVIFYLYILFYTLVTWYYIVAVKLSGMKFLDDCLIYITVFINTIFVFDVSWRKYNIKYRDEYWMKKRLSSAKVMGVIVLVSISVYLCVSYYFWKEGKRTLAGILSPIAYVLFMSPSILLVFNFKETIGLFEKIRSDCNKAIGFLKNIVTFILQKLKEYYGKTMELFEKIKHYYKITRDFFGKIKTFVAKKQKNKPTKNDSRK